MITEQQRASREKYICSSDAPAICGCDPFRNAAAVWLEKTGQVDPFAGNANTRRGILLEPVLLNWAEEELGIKLQRDAMLIHPNGLLAANLDGYCPEQGAIIEAKTATNADEWGDEGTDQVPERTIIQAHHQMAVAGERFRVAWVPVLLAVAWRFEFRMYRVDRNNDLASVVAAKGEEFMQKYVRAGVRPDDFSPPLDVLKRMRRVPSKSVPLPDEIVDHWIAARAARLQAEQDEDEAQLALMAALSDAEEGTYAAGSVTYFEQKRKEHVVKASVFRVLRLKAAKQLAATAAKEAV